MTPQEIINGMRDKNILLTQQNNEYSELMAARAEAQRVYSVALAQKIIALKIEGKPSTGIKVLAEGDKTVADLKHKLDIADGVVKAIRESMNNIRIAIDSYRSILTWQREELHRS